jgi:hypothetical protein
MIYVTDLYKIEIGDAVQGYIGEAAALAAFRALQLSDQEVHLFRAIGSNDFGEIMWDLQSSNLEENEY